MAKQAIEMLKISKEHRYWDWEPAAFIGFDYFYFLKDNINASKYFMEVSRYPGTTPFYGIFGARLAQRAGQTRAGIDFLTNIYNTTENETYKEEIKIRIDALHGVLLLEKAIEKFTAKYNHLPQKLDELLTAKILPALPQNPYNKPYILKDGIIDF